MATATQRPDPTSSGTGASPPDRRRFGLGTSVLVAGIGAVLLLVSGIATVMAGAVRWQECFGMIVECSVMSDTYSLREGFAAPLGVGMVLLYLAILVLSAAVARWWLVIVTALIGSSIVIERTLWSPEFAADRAALEYGPVPVEYTSVETALATPGALGALAVVGVMTMALRPNGGSVPLTRAIGGTLVALGLGWSIWAYAVLAPITGTWDDATHMWTLQGIVAILGAIVVLMALAWEHGRRESAPDGFARPSPAELT